jgi:hypothetical protein
MSTIRKTIAAIARQLEESPFFQDEPVIDVIPNDAKDLLTRLEKAPGPTKGAWAVVGFDGARGLSNDVPGPDFRDGKFFVEVSENPTIWRNKDGRPATVEEMAEAVARLLHLHYPTAATGEAIPGVNSPLRLDDAIGEPVENANAVSIRIPFLVAMTFDPATEPERDGAVTA